jgi:hypothetical protein
MRIKSYKEKLSKAEFPQLYSKRGLERKRFRIIIPYNRNELAYIKDFNGKLILIP